MRCPASAVRPLVLTLLLLAAVGASSAAPPPAPPPSPGPEAESEPVAVEGPESPRGAVREFLDDARHGAYDRAANRLDLSWIAEDERSARGPVLARHLKAVLDQKLWVDLESLSGAPEGLRDDGLPPGVDRVGTLKTSHGDVEIRVARSARADGTEVWRFARSTTRRIPELYAEFGYGALGEVLPEWMFRGRFLEIETWQWLGLIVLVAAAWLVGVIGAWLLLRVARPIAARTESDLDDVLLARTVGPLRWIIALATFAPATLLLRLSVPAHALLSGLERGLAVVLATWVVLRWIDVIEDVLRRRFAAEGRTALIATLPLGSRTLKVALFLLAGIALLQNLGFNVTGLLAGLGVGGLAVALAAQKTVENLFGGVAITVDQPVRVGDFCAFGDKVGTVEDIGLRSTRIRTLDRTVVSIPNAEFAQIQIENFATRDRMRVIVTLGLRYETTPDQLRHVLAGLRELLVAHPRILPDPCRVRFVAFGAYSLDLEVFAYVDTQDYNEFLAVREDLFLRMMDVVERSGSGFAFPSQTLYMGRDGGLDDTRSREAEREVAAWREAGRLPFPDFDAEALGTMRDRLDYPPRGSAVARDRA